jgi:hypothetical protein
MNLSVVKIERYARYTMAVIAVLAVFAGICLRVGLISKAPFYHDEHWYLESSNSTFVIISEYTSEAECRQNEKAFTTCRSGRVLSEEARGQNTAINLY